MRTLSNPSAQMSLVSVLLPPKCLTSPFELRGPCYKMTSRHTELVISEMPGVHFFPGSPEHSLSGNQHGYLQWQKALVGTPGVYPCRPLPPTTMTTHGCYASFPPSLLSPNSSKCTVLGFLQQIQS